MPLIKNLGITLVYYQKLKEKTNKLLMNRKIRKNEIKCLKHNLSDNNWLWINKKLNQPNYLL